MSVREQNRTPDHGRRTWPALGRGTLPTAVAGLVVAAIVTFAVAPIADRVYGAGVSIPSDPRSVIAASIAANVLVLALSAVAALVTWNARRSR